MKFTDVKDAVRAYMTSREDGTRTTSYVQIDLAREFGIDIQPHNWSGYRQSEGQAFLNQVYRALGQLVDEGFLAREKRFTRGRRKEILWIRKDVAEARLQDRQAEETARASRQALYDQQQVRFGELGYQVRVVAGTKAAGLEPGSVIFGPADAARLFSKLAAS